MPALVDYDPFAAPAAKPAAKPKPVAGDPFAWANPEKAVEGALGEPVRVTSTRRSAEHNAAVGGSKTSSHMTGQAIDFVPKDGNLDAAAARLAGSNLPYDQVIREGDHVHVGWGPKGRRQALGTSPAAAPRPVEGDPFAQPPPAAAGPKLVAGDPFAAAPKPVAAKPPPAKPVPIRGTDLSSDAKSYLDDVFQRDIKAPWAKAGEHFSVKPSNKSFIGSLADTARGPLDVGGAVLSSLGAIPDALLAKPYGQGVSALTGGKYTADQGRGDMMSALGAVRPGKGLSKMPDFGPGFKMPPKIRSPKEPLFADPAGQYRPPEPKEPGPIYGVEPKRPERVDNALHRVRTNETADKLRAVQSRARVRKALGPEDQVEGENLTHELEQALVDPKRKLSERAEQALTQVSKLKDQQTADMNAIRRLAAKHGATVEDYLGDQGHVPRRVVGKARGFDDGLVDHPDPITGRGVALNKTTSALKGRASWRMLQPVDGKGPPIWVDGKTAAAHPERYEKLGSTLSGSGGRKFRVRQPTIAEIEQHTAGTDHATTYHKNYFDLIHDDWVRVRQVRRNLEVLDASLSDLKAQGLAHHGEWMRPADVGGGKTVMTPQRNAKPAPEGFVELPHIKQLKGWSFAPEIAEVFKDYKPGPGTSTQEVLSKINGTLTSSLFWNPLPHTWNVANDWAKARGIDWLPGRGGYSSLIRNGSQAVHAVITKNDLYQELLREGASLMGADQDMRNFHEVMLGKGVKQLQQEPGAMSRLMHAFDLKGLAPQKIIASIYKAAGHELWNASDSLMIQRILELRDRGMDTRAAIKLAEKDIASYRVPSRVLNNGKIGRMISEQTRNPNVFLFGRYHYGMLKSWGTMFKDLYAGKPEERTEAVGKFLAAMMLAHGVYPMLDALAQKVTGSKDARTHRGGGMGLPDAMAEFSKGQKDWMAMMSRLIDPAPTLGMLRDISTGRDVFGQQIVNPQAKPAEKAAEVAEDVAGYVSPVGDVIRATKPEGAKRFVARNLLVDLPSSKAASGKRFAAQKDKKAAARRRRTDPIVKAAGGL